MISILVLTFNHLDKTKQFLELLYKNTKPEFNLVIVDNGSSDGTKDFLEKLEYKNLIVHYNWSNRGIIGGRNQAYRILKNNFEELDKVIFLDNDQFVKKNWDNYYLDLFSLGYDIVGIEAWKMRSNFLPYCRINSIKEEFSYIGCGGMMIKNSVIEDIGLFDVQFNPFYFEDPDFCFRGYQKGYRIGWCSENIIEHQKHDLTLKGERKKVFFENLNKFYKKWREISLPLIKMGEQE
jgi:GT2 family glycosyltransferase